MLNLLPHFYGIVKIILTNAIQLQNILTCKCFSFLIYTTFDATNFKEAMSIHVFVSICEPICSECLCMFEHMHMQEIF